MSYHIPTYGYTHKFHGCKRTRLDFGKPYWNEKTKNAKVFWTLAFFFAPKFGVPKRIKIKAQHIEFTMFCRFHLVDTYKNTLKMKIS